MCTEIMVVNNVRLCKHVFRWLQHVVCLACTALEVGQICLQRSLEVWICLVNGEHVCLGTSKQCLSENNPAYSLSL